MARLFLLLLFSFLWGWGRLPVHYHDIGDYLTREQKLDLVKKFKSVHGRSIQWQTIEPTDRHDWINQRDGLFDTLIPLFPEKKFDSKSHSFFSTYSLGTATARDSWVYNYGLDSLRRNMGSTINFYNEESSRLQSTPEYELSSDSTKISWNDSLKNICSSGTSLSYSEADEKNGIYRPFSKQHLYFQREWIQRPYQLTKFFPSPNIQNILIGVSGLSGSRPFSTLVTDVIPNLHLNENGQCFPLYWYEENKNT